MTSEIFNFKRFGNYFRYDLKQMWRNHSKPAVFIGGLGLIVYVLWVLMGLVFSGGHWDSPETGARISVFVAAFIVLVLYQTRTYGYLTEKQKGSAWLMIPASSLEKFISMLLITLIVIPLLFVVVFLAIDSILVLLDPTLSQTIAGSALGELQDAQARLSESQSSTFFTPSGGIVTVLIILSLVSSLLFFLLSGLCFKRYKILGGVGVLFALEVVISILASVFIPDWARTLVDLDEVNAAQAVGRMFNWSVAVSALIAIGLAVGIYYRIKTIKH